MASKLYKAIISSTFSPNTPVDVRRTPYIFTMESIGEINKQINALHEAGTEIEILNQAPEKGVENYIVGKIISSEIKYDDVLECFQCIANIHIVNEQAIRDLEKNKERYAFFPNIAYNEQKSLKVAVTTDENNTAENVYYLYPPLKIVAMNLGLKRSSSNPYLRIL